MLTLPRIVFLLLFPFTVLAQKPPIKFGDVPIESLKMVTYEKDTSASAVLLADYGESIIQYDQNDGFILHFERLRRIKILSKDGLDYANFSIPLYHDSGDSEKLAGLKAVTYNLENGKVQETKLKNDGIFTEKHDANFDITKITMPNVKVGSVIEITYSVRSEFIFNFQDWEFQSTIPALWSEYRARIPEYFAYERYMQGYVPIAVNEQTREPNSITLTSKERTGGRGWSSVSTSFSQDKIDFQEYRYRWAAKDVPAFKPEPYITTERDYISKINFELASIKYPNQTATQYMGSWDDINKQYYESPDFHGEITGNGYLKRTVEEITAGLTTPEDKVAAISVYVKTNLTWDGTSRRFPSKSLKKVLEEKKGSSAEINLLMASLLEKADIKVSPVLLSTRDHGFVRETTPVSSQFNYVICMATIGEKKYLLDATEKYLPTGILPQRCLNGNGFVVSKETYQWVPLLAGVKSRTAVNAELTLGASGEMTGKLNIDRGGYDALASRKSYFAKEEKEYIKDFVGSRPWEISKSTFESVKEIDKPLKESHELTISEQVVTTPDALYFNPLLMFKVDENPFKLESRLYPVDYGSGFDRMYMCKLTIPDGYHVDELPQPKVIGLPASAGKYSYSIVRNDKHLIIVSNLQINKSIFTQLEYPNLREFYNQLVAKQAEQIVLKKK
jgi:transglutaminase-like putative cysteine protease